MKSTRFTDWLVSFIVSMLSLLLIGQGRPLWLYVLLPGTVLFLSLLSTYRPGCSIQLLSVLFFFASWVLLYVVTNNALQAFLTSVCIVAVLNVLRSQGIPSWLWLVALGVSLNFSSHVGRLQTAFLFVFTLLVVLWLRVRIEKKMLMAFVAVSLLCAIVLANFNFSIVAWTLKRLPVKRSEEKQQIVQLKPLGGMTPESSQKAERSSRSFELVLEKVFFPIVLLLFGVFLLTLSLKLFKLKGTILLFLIGALIFGLTLSVLSVIFSLVKPKFELVQMSPESTATETEMSQTRFEFVESAPATVTGTRSNVRGLIDFLNWSSLILLVLASAFLVYMTVYVSKQSAMPIKLGEPSKAVTGQDVEGEEPFHLDRSQRSVIEAYWWLRNKFFAGLNHLTPYEVLKLAGDFEPFGKLTRMYVMLRYGNRNLTDAQIDEFYEHFLATSRWLEEKRTSHRGGDVSS
ncbi:hypothetical protein AS159_01605 [Thermotoga sp. Ku-13t]|uniref:hypothetical protein n=1 Tax=Thermotoga sp. Ku-13t TaxID=1755813 RepID=UPI0013EA3B8D|nr:hypothetical protein [Thermotoga sp. Ku-13t]KAF2958423.1 hypothetical protein AS159_01605 [Thermotoga sp. Ku-13t]